MFCSLDCQLCQKLSGGTTSSKGFGLLRAIGEQLRVDPSLTELAISHVIGSLQEHPKVIARFLSLSPTFCLDAFVMSKICKAWKTVRVIQYLQEEFKEMHNHKLNAEASSVFFVLYMFDNSFLNIRININMWSILHDNFEADSVFDSVLTQENHFKRAAIIINSCPNKEQTKKVGPSHSKPTNVDFTTCSRGSRAKTDFGKFATYSKPQTSPLGKVMEVTTSDHFNPRAAIIFLLRCYQYVHRVYDH